MKTIGLLGGMSWESTVPYYQIINRTIRERLGGFHSAKILLYSVDFDEVEQLQRANRWDEAGEMLASVAVKLEAAGADFLVLCTNTMHKVAASIEARVQVPLLHVTEPTALAIVSAGFSKVGLLGTRFTMEQDFYKSRLEQNHGLQVLVPSAIDREIVHRIIFQELVLGKIADSSRIEYRRVIASLISQGVQCIILGCTEIALLVSDTDASVPLFDTTALHARSAALYALGETDVACSA